MFTWDMAEIRGFSTHVLSKMPLFSPKYHVNLNHPSKISDSGIVEL